MTNSQQTFGSRAVRHLGLVAIVLSACSHLAFGEATGDANAERLYEWRSLPDLPEPIGLAGPFAGISNDALIVAGGAHFPVPLFEGGAKVWVDEVYVLRKDANDAYLWHTGYKLDKPLAYGSSITTDRGLICIGGCDANEFYADVFLLTWAGGKIERHPLPPLPKPCAFSAAAKLGDTIYLAGGQESASATTAMKTFWSLDLSDQQAEWRQLDPWPGPGRILPVAAAHDGCFYLFSGCELLPGEDGKATRRYLVDAYRFSPNEGWRRIADLPAATAAAPSPAPDYGQSHLLVFGGDDGMSSNRVWELKDKHPGFSKDILAYHTITDTWAKMGALPAGHVTTVAVTWGDSIVIPSGEVRPGIRTPAVLEGVPVRHKASFGLINYSVLTLYLLILVGMGLYFSRREETTENFFLAGRRIPWWAAGVSIFGTQLSAITFMAIPAKTYATDWVYFLVNVCIVLISPVVVFVYLPFYRRLNVTTAYEYLERRFNLAVRLFGSAAYILLQLGRMAIVIFLPAIALSTVTGIGIYSCILLMGLICTFYTVLGGIEAVIWSDVLQVAVLLGGATLSLVIIAFKVENGLAGIISTAAANGKFHIANLTWDWTTTALWVVVVGNLLAQLVPYTADQTVVQRYLTTSDQKQAAKSIWTNAALTIPSSLVFFALGTALFVFYKAHPGSLEPSLDTDAILPLFIVQQLPAGVCGLLIAGVFAAAMSSLDSSMNSVATAIVTDFYRRLKPGSSDTMRLALARWLTAALGATATAAGLLMATCEIKSLWDLFLKVLGLFGGSLAGLFALGIFTRRAHGWGALLGALTSALVLFVVVWFTRIHFFLYSGIGIAVCFAVGYLASLLIPANPKNTQGLTIYHQ
ncbi:MAG: sodium/solute symporter [Sedimentisphaerales bacterium]|nr:sodium/solute symporter [Sedimentisphaerales bacterium]